MRTRGSLFSRKKEHDESDNSPPHAPIRSRGQPVSLLSLHSGGYFQFLAPVGIIFIFAYILFPRMEPVLMRESFDRGYDTGASTVPGKINVHLVPHSHDDVGWLKTPDQYYAGSHQEIQVACVECILDTVTDQLLADPNRKFIQVEQAFFKRWWERQSPARQQDVKRLVRNGQLEVINGGWCMHDEAATLYVDMIDQMSLGARFIASEFGVSSRIAWQIDPFGHSAVQSYLITAEAGFDAVFFARGDYQDFKKRTEDKSLEFVWRASETLGESAQVFGAWMHDHYYRPDGFAFESRGSYDTMVDDPLDPEMNVAKYVDMFVAHSKKQAADMRTNHIMWAMGEDFSYADAHSWYREMDKLITYVNQNGSVHALYSTPSVYLDALHRANETWPLKRYDFFPYADCPECYWTGYFSSRPAFKRYVRQLGALLQAGRQMEVLFGPSLSEIRRKKDAGPKWTSVWQDLYMEFLNSGTRQLEEAMGIAQHHDAVTGTAKQHVNDDYTKTMYSSALRTEEVFTASVAKVLKLPLLKDHHEDAAGAFKMCPMLNISYCPATQKSLWRSKTLIVVAYNPLGWKRVEFVRIPIRSANVTVRDEYGNTVVAQVIPALHLRSNIRRFYILAHAGPSAIDLPFDPVTLVFSVTLPPFAFRTFFISEATTGATATMSEEVSMKGAAPTSTFRVAFTGEGGQARRDDVAEEQKAGKESGKEDTRAMFSAKTGQLKRTFGAEKYVDVLEDDFLYYMSDTMGTQYEGAYLFHPNGTQPVLVQPKSKKRNRLSRGRFKVLSGPLVVEVHRQVADWAWLVYRFYKGEVGGEMQYTVGPLPEDGTQGFNGGKNLVFRFATNVNSGVTFFTDSNGRDYLKRVKNYRADWTLTVTEPIAGNYYPINAGIFVSDGQSDFSVLVDRASGASSLESGQVEVMLHRRIMFDDSRGVEEPLNEMVCANGGQTGDMAQVCLPLVVTGALRFSGLPTASASEWRRTTAQKTLAPVQLAFAFEADFKDSQFLRTSSEHRGICRGDGLPEDYELPPNVAVITLQRLEEYVLVRLAHLYEAGEDEKMSKLARVDLRKLLGGLQIQSAEELSLMANQKKSGMKGPMKWNIADLERIGDKKVVRGGPLDRASLMVELGPMEIRTFALYGLDAC